MPYKDPEIARVHRHQYYLDNKDKWKDYAEEHPKDRSAYMKGYSHSYYLANKEECDNRHRLYDLAHTEECRQRVAKWQHDNPDAYHAAQKKWFDANLEKAHLATEQWYRDNPIAAKKIRAKKTAKRRTLGFIPINLPFIGADAHHLDKERVMYIPRALHKSISHNQWTGRGMAKMNALAYEWLAQVPA